jgi:hypothetical protein
MLIEAWGADSLRVRINPGEVILDETLSGLQPTTTDDQLFGIHFRWILYLSNSTLAEEGNIFANGNLIFDGHCFSRQNSSSSLFCLNQISFYPLQQTNRYPLYAASMSIGSTEDERIYGLGQHLITTTNMKNTTILFENCSIYDYSHGSCITIPFYLSSRG